MTNPDPNFHLFQAVIRDLLVSIKSGILYQADHPFFIQSVQKLKTSLDEWFNSREGLDIGISTDNLFLDFESFDNKDANFEVIANLLHTRGIISVSIARHVRLEDLTAFLQTIKYDSKEIERRGGMECLIPPECGIRIKEIDYRSVLKSDEHIDPAKEEAIWNHLFNRARSLATQDLPESKVELLVDFFRDTQKAASVLNRIYKQAFYKQSGSDFIIHFHNVIHQICSHFDRKEMAEDARAFKGNLAGVISHLHPELIERLFEETTLNKQKWNLAEAILHDCSDSFMAAFFESLISRQGSVNEYLLRVFNKIMPDENRMKNILHLVSDRLFAGKMVQPHSLTRLQISIQELFKTCPQETLVAELYKMTVDAVIHRKQDCLTYVPRLIPDVNRFVYALKKNKLVLDKTWLLCNLLRIERSSDDFEIFMEQLAACYLTLLKLNHFDAIRQILEFVSEGLKRDRDSKKATDIIRMEAVGRLINRDTVEILFSAIPDADPDEIANISEILMLARPRSVSLMIGAFVRIKDTRFREKCQTLFLRMKADIVEEVLRRIETSNPNVLKDLFTIVQICDPRMINSAARKMITSKNTIIQWEVLERFVPQSDGEITYILDLLRKEKNRQIQRKAISSLLKTGKNETVYQLFRFAQKRKNRSGILLDLIELCGIQKSEKAYPYLKRLLSKRSFFRNKKNEVIRFAAAKALFQLNPLEARHLVGKQWPAKAKGPAVQKTKAAAAGTS